MPQWTIDLFGPGLGQIVWVALVAAVVCVLAVVVIVLAKRFVGGGTGIGPRVRAPRLQVVDVARIDEKRRLVLLRRDDVEHLVLVGGQTDILVEGSILRQAASAHPPVRSDDGRLDIAATPPPPRRPAAPVVDGGTERRAAMVAEQAAAATAPRRDSASSGHVAPAPEMRSDPRRVTPAPRSAPEAELPAQAGAAPTIERPTAERPAPAVQRRQDPAPAVIPQAALKPTEPPALNPTKHAFSRATPMPAAETPPPAARAMDPRLSPATQTDQARRAPEAPAPRTAASATPPPAPTPPAAKTAVADAPTAGTLPAAAREPIDTSRPLSVRSFASAIQNRRYSRVEEPRREPALTPGPVTAASPANPVASAAAGQSDDAAALDRSLEEFLSGELSSGIEEEAAAERAAAVPEVRPARPAPAAKPAQAEASPAPRVAARPAPPVAADTEPAAETEATEPPVANAKPTRESDPHSQWSQPESPEEPAEASTPAPRPQAPRRAPAASPEPETTAQAEPSTRRPAPSAKSDAATQPARPAARAAAPTDQAAGEQRSDDASRPETPQNGPQSGQKSEEINLEEEMKRLLGELDFDRPTQRQRQ
ncbi:hypothetical protein E3C22_18630 [Jiella endophytica]|uniref:Flagellar biosynthesis protein FliO n=1 Tax=Jiella endophytica TaxID=2558362 RepID=A0A4Y8RD08_9HYPH|nr:flagellar biosynthetic protein FliO [Jiella endophytica]TFF19707.1 hypothetical protein E3C22_18630 [Jiella endophytica]